MGADDGLLGSGGEGCKSYWINDLEWSGLCWSCDLGPPSSKSSIFIVFKNPIRSKKLVC